MFPPDERLLRAQIAERQNEVQRNNERQRLLGSVATVRQRAPEITDGR
jgi:hypothetical protein